jgi:hypothetical protein
MIVIAIPCSPAVLQAWPLCNCKFRSGRMHDVECAMPFLRGRFFPEVTSTGRSKRSLGILLWLVNWSTQHISRVNEVEVLRRYLHSLNPSVCTIDLFVPDSHLQSIDRLTQLEIPFKAIPISKPSADTLEQVDDTQLAECSQTALTNDADVVLVSTQDWFPYFEELEKLGLFLTDTSFLKHRCEIFARSRCAAEFFSTNMESDMDRVLSPDGTADLRSRNEVPKLGTKEERRP